MRVPARSLPFALLLVAPVAAQPLPTDAEAVGRMKKDLFFLAGPECEGRGVGTAGLDKAAEHVAAQFKAAGLKVSFQPFTMLAFPEVEGPSTLVFTGGDKR